MSIMVSTSAPSTAAAPFAKPSDTRFDVCIRGAGIVGRSLALLLAAQRLRVALVHQPAGQTAGHSDVRAYALNQPARTLLEGVRCWPEAAQATPVLRMEVHGRRVPV